MLGAAGHGSSQLSRRHVGKRALELVLAHLVDDVEGQRARLVQVARQASHGLQDRKIGLVQACSPVRGEPGDVLRGHGVPGSSLLGQGPTSVGKRQGQDPAGLQLGRSQALAGQRVGIFEQGRRAVPQQGQAALHQADEGAAQDATIEFEGRLGGGLPERTPHLLGNVCLVDGEEGSVDHQVPRPLGGIPHGPGQDPPLIPVQGRQGSAHQLAHVRRPLGRREDPRGQDLRGGTGCARRCPRRRRPGSSVRSRRSTTVGRVRWLMASASLSTWCSASSCM